MAGVNISTRDLPKGKTSHVYIIHAEKDSDWAKGVKKDLIENNFLCILKESDHLSCNLLTIKCTCVVIVLFSKHFLLIPSCKKEGDDALWVKAHKGRNFLNVIPLNLDNTPIPAEYEAASQGLFVGDCKEKWLQRVLKAVTQDVEYQCNAVDLKSLARKGEEFDSEERRRDAEFATHRFLFDLMPNDELHFENSEITYLSNELVSELRGADLFGRLEFLRDSKRNGLTDFIEKNEIPERKSNPNGGMGMKIRQDVLYLDWGIFEQKVLTSELSKIDILRHDQLSRIRKVDIKCSEGTNARMTHRYGQKWKDQFIRRAETILLGKSWVGSFTGGSFSSTSSGTSFYRVDYHICTENYRTVAKRLASYEKWPVNLNALKEYFAKAGFIYTGQDDVIICFSCHTTLYGMEKLLSIVNQENFYLIPWFSHSSHHCSHVASNVWIDCKVPSSLNAKGEQQNKSTFKGNFFETSVLRFCSFNSALVSYIREDLALAGFYYSVYPLLTAEKSPISFVTRHLNKPPIKKSSDVETRVLSFSFNICKPTLNTCI